MTTDYATSPGAPAADAKAPILEVRDLRVEFFVDGEWFPAAEDVSYDVRPGEVLAIVGESGSGKTQSSMSLIGLLPPNGRSEGSAKLAGRELLGLNHKQLSKVRGKDVSVIFQEPMTALNPVYTVGFQIVETLRVHFDMTPKQARARAIELLRMVDLPNPEESVDKYPHQLSGGQRQRAMIAQALACEPKLLIADEPTTALDVTVQAEILKLMRDLRHRVDAGIILITHDMGVVADLSDRVMVMKNGRVVESGSSDEVFNRPQHEYTRQLLDAVPHLGSETFAASGLHGEHPVADAEGTAALHVSERPLGQPLPRPGVLDAAQTGYSLEAKGLVIEYPGRGRVPAFRAINGIDLSIGKGEVVGLVGESGSGKTTVGRAAVGLLPVAGGSLEVNGVELAGIKPKDLRAVRQDVSIVFQDPGSSLNPRLPIGESIGEPLKLHKIASGADLDRRVESLLDRVHLPRAMRNRYPHELSGGQRQRVGIARALALSPKLLIADEPTSALDVSVQARVLELFQELQREYGFACLFISHDLAVVEILSNRIAVMSKGDLVEVGPREQILRSPQQDYTKRLLAAVPVPNPAEQKLRREERDRLLAAAAPAGSSAAESAVADGQRVQAFEDEQITNAGRYEGNIRPRGPVDGGSV